MSELKVNKISPATGTAFTLGDSGDTFTLPSGATITNSGTATGFGGLTLTAETATTGNNIIIGSIPSGVKEIHVLTEGSSTNGIGIIGLQIGDAGGIEATGYQATCCENLATATATIERTDMFIWDSVLVAADKYYGIMTLRLQDAANNYWLSSSVMTSNNNARQVCNGSGGKALSGELTQISYMTTDTNFDVSGAVSIQYQQVLNNMQRKI